MDGGNYFAPAWIALFIIVGVLLCIFAISPYIIQLWTLVWDFLEEKIDDGHYWILLIPGFICIAIGYVIYKFLY